MEPDTIKKGAGIASANKAKVRFNDLWSFRRRPINKYRTPKPRHIPTTIPRATL